MQNGRTERSGRVDWDVQGGTRTYRMGGGWIGRFRIGGGWTGSREPGGAEVVGGSGCARWVD